MSETDAADLQARLMVLATDDEAEAGEAGVPWGPSPRPRWPDCGVDSPQGSPRSPKGSRCPPRLLPPPAAVTEGLPRGEEDAAMGDEEGAPPLRHCHRSNVALSACMRTGTPPAVPCVQHGSVRCTMKWPNTIAPRHPTARKKAVIATRMATRCHGASLGQSIGLQGDMWRRPLPRPGAGARGRGFRAPGARARGPGPGGSREERVWGKTEVEGGPGPARPARPGPGGAARPGPARATATGSPLGCGANWAPGAWGGRSHQACGTFDMGVKMGILAA